MHTLKILFGPIFIGEDYSAMRRKQNQVVNLILLGMIHLLFSTLSGEVCHNFLPHLFVTGCHVVYEIFLASVNRATTSSIKLS